MGKTGPSSSWLTAVKRAFRSPTKGNSKRTCKIREEHRQEDEEEKKKTEKRRWIFRKLTSHPSSNEVHVVTSSKPTNQISTDEQKSPVAEVRITAVAKTQAAQKSVWATTPSKLVREEYAALVIQTAFRGYLARRALCALKGIVKLQALIRGHNVRRQAQATLKCMQALIRVQTKMRNQCSRHSHEGNRKSMFAESNNLWDKYKDIRQRKSTSRDGNKIADQWENHLCTIEDIEAMLRSRKEAALNHENTVAYALSQQRHDGNRDEKESEKDTGWLNQRIESKEYSENDNGLLTSRRDSIKNVDMESLHPHLKSPNNFQWSQRQEPQNRRHSLHVASPLRKAYSDLSHKSPTTPPMCHTRPIHVRSASPQCLRECRSHSTTSTPSLRSNYQSRVSSYRQRTESTATTPNYMAATESAKARARTQSTPRQRSSTSDRERGGPVKKRLSYPVPDPISDGSIYTELSCFSQDIRSPSFRSVQGGMYGLERGTMCSCYTDSAGGELSPASTTHIRRWLS